LPDAAASAGDGAIEEHRRKRAVRGWRWARLVEGDAAAWSQSQPDLLASECTGSVHSLNFAPSPEIGTRADIYL